jgi:hypothetical protein
MTAHRAATASGLRSQKNIPAAPACASVPNTTT